MLGIDKQEVAHRIKIYLFLRKPLTLTTTGVIIQKPIKVVTLTSYRSPHTRCPQKKRDLKNRHVGNLLVLQFFVFRPHVINRGGTRLRRKVTMFYINLQRAGCQSAICLNPSHPLQS